MSLDGGAVETAGIRGACADSGRPYVCLKVKIYGRSGGVGEAAAGSAQCLRSLRQTESSSGMFNNSVNWKSDKFSKSKFTLS